MKMRLHLLFVLFVMMSVVSLAQNSDLIIPQAVKNRMLARFPQTQDVPVTWTKDGVNYKGSLIIMDKPAFAIIDETGKLVRLEKTIHFSYLPKKISDYLSRQYIGYQILDVYEITDSSGIKTYKTTFQYKQTMDFNVDGVPLK